jgi:hypothetical protein
MKKLLSILVLMGIIGGAALMPVLADGDVANDDDSSESSDSSDSSDSTD